MSGEYKAVRTGLVLIAGILILCSRPAAAGVDEFTRLYGAFQAKYWRGVVTTHGINTTVFDYAAMAGDVREEYSLYTGVNQALSTVDPGRLTDETAKAFWLNAYNFGAMKLVIENYPVTSIRDFKISWLRYPWSKEAIQIGGRGYSLEQIEKEILLKQFHDPRIVFGISCAAISCPDRTPEPFQAGELDGQLDAIIRHFFENRTKGLMIDTAHGRVWLSWILKKDRRLFGATDAKLKEFVCGYVTPSVCARIKPDSMKIAYFKHDWTLNDSALAGVNHN